MLWNHPYPCRKNLGLSPKANDALDVEHRHVSKCPPERCCFTNSDKNKSGGGQVWAVGWMFQHRLSSALQTAHVCVQQCEERHCRATTPDPVSGVWMIVPDCWLQYLHGFTVAFSTDSGPTFHEANQKNASMMPKGISFPAHNANLRFWLQWIQDISMLWNVFSFPGCHGASASRLVRLRYGNASTTAATPPCVLSCAILSTILGPSRHTLFGNKLLVDDIVHNRLG